MTSTTRTTAAVALALASAFLAACGSATSAEPKGAPDEADRIVREAPKYVGDPWERRYREQFWAEQHLHDSWNPCHLGENVPDSMKGEGPGCYSRLRSQTGR
jgi:hypothetical protein